MVGSFGGWNDEVRCTGAEARGAEIWIQDVVLDDDGGLRDVSTTGSFLDDTGSISASGCSEIASPRGASCCVLNKA